MNIEKKQLSCVCCKAYLFEEDDVVYCPVCGAPHHRDCYNRIQHCALEELHGTENEYNKEAELLKRQTADSETEKENKSYTTCNICGEKYNSLEGKCPNCKSENFQGFGIYQSFDFLGGVPADLKLDGDITAEQAKKFVAANTHRYIPKFAILNKNNKLSWNWMAFLFPSGWMLSRKMYKNGIIAGILSIIASLLTYPLSLQLYQMGFSNNISYQEMATQLMESLPNIGAGVLILSMVGAIFNLTIRIISALFGDYLYRSYTLSTIKEINQTSEDADYDFRKKGGVNIFLFFIGTMIIEYLPSIIASFI